LSLDGVSIDSSLKFRELLALGKHSNSSNKAVSSN
jgi:hypothetical protein